MKKTAIILFANLPDFEARSKSFCGFSSKKATQKLSSILTNHFYQLAKQTTADSFLIDSYHQKGKTFGERLSNAFVDIYAKGYENVICIGNDCPALTLTQIESSIFKTENGDVVLGPTVDGGAYLIGIPKIKFNASTFEQIKWQSSKTYKNLKNHFQRLNAAISETETLADIDQPEDIFSANNKSSLFNILVQLILSYSYAFIKKPLLFSLEYNKVDASSLKAPPTLFVSHGF